MKAAVVLNAAGAPIQEQAAGINRLLQGMPTVPAELELWLLGAQDQPECLPVIAGSVSGIELIPAPDPHDTENLLGLLQRMQAFKSRDLFLFGSDGLAEELATRLAYRLGGCSCLQVEGLELGSSQVTVQKPAYCSHLKARLRLERGPFCLCAARAPGPPAALAPAPCAVNLRDDLEQSAPSWQGEASFEPDGPPCGLARADRVLALGQGAGSRDNVARLQEVAEAMGAELGASRPVVMNAWAPMERLIGVSGLMLSPKLCIAAGVSGSAAFSAGIKNSGLIVALNTDPEAPIFRLAQVGVVEDLHVFLAELQKLLEADKE